MMTDLLFYLVLCAIKHPLTIMLHWLPNGGYIKLVDLIEVQQINASGFLLNTFLDGYLNVAKVGLPQLN